ncbi:MAG: hypothetical protein AAF483_18180 [Planctomycetota bacterium]
MTAIVLSNRPRTFFECILLPLLSASVLVTLPLFAMQTSAVASGPGARTQVVAVPCKDCTEGDPSKCKMVFLRDQISETVDLIELNHYYDDLGRHSYDQVIFYEWSPDYARFHVIAWSLIEKDQAKKPRKDPHRGDYYASWYDREAKVHRIVRSRVFTETWSRVDPERANKKLLEEKYRRHFIKPEKVKR